MARGRSRSDEGGNQKVKEGGRRKRREERKEENLKGMTDQKEKVESLRNEGEYQTV